MKLRKRNAFTLIELIATLVIMSIIALIVTPLVMNIIRKARISADKRSVDAYGRSIELAISGYLMDTGSFPTSIDELTIEYSGNKVECETTQINPDSSVYLSNCKVNNREVTNYTYGTDKSPLATEARLITTDDLVADLGYEYYEEGTYSGYRKTGSTPSWVYNSNYWYWTSTQYSDSMSTVWVIGENRDRLDNNYKVFDGANTRGMSAVLVRPVITLPKSAL